MRIRILTWLLLPASLLQAQWYVSDPITSVYEHGRELAYPFAGGLNNPQCWPVELNNDGQSDMLIFDRNGGKVLPFEYVAESGYTYAPQYEARFPSMEYFVVTADYNCDGLPDLFTAFDDGVKVYRAVAEPDGIYFEESVEKLTYREAGFTFDVAVGIIDIPGFKDVDGDGDLDLLTFKLVGGYVDYFQNQAVENGDDCGVLDLLHVNSCWGDFYESGFYKAVELDSSCSEEVTERSQVLLSGLHAGSTFVIFDEDNDSDMDLLLGDLSFDNINFIRNGGDAEFAYMVEQDTAYPFYNIPVSITTFPAPFLLDVDKDGFQDLIVAPNKEGFGDNIKQVWYYRNTATDGSYTFEYQHDSLFVSEMMDFGSGAHPAFFDYNNDGLLDLVVGNYGYFEEGIFIGSLALYENIGTSSEPVYALITRNYANMDIYGFRNLHPTFGDLDADGDLDMIIGEETGFIHFFRNVAAASEPASFVLIGPNYQDIDVGKFSTPQLVDVNSDGLLDLIIGEENGNLNFYRNDGTASAADFTLIDELWGAVDVRKPLTLTGYSSPWLYWNADNMPELLVGSLSGSIYQYEPTSDFTGSFLKLTDFYSAIDEGAQSNLCLADITNDNIPELIIGNDRGGVALYREASTLPDQVEADFLDIQTQIFPNPVLNNLCIASSSNMTYYCLLNLNGQKILSETVPSAKSIQISFDHILPGFYLLVLEYDNGYQQTLKVVK